MHDSPEGETLTFVPQTSWPAMATPVSLLAELSPTERLVGYEMILDAVVVELGSTATNCLRSSRFTSAGRVPSVLVALDTRLLEFWLVGNTVRWAGVRRPGIPPDPAH